MPPAPLLAWAPGDLKASQDLKILHPDNVVVVFKHLANLI